MSLVFVWRGGGVIKMTREYKILTLRHREKAPPRSTSSRPHLKSAPLLVKQRVALGFVSVRYVWITKGRLHPLQAGLWSRYLNFRLRLQNSLVQKMRKKHFIMCQTISGKPELKFPVPASKTFRLRPQPSKIALGSGFRALLLSRWLRTCKSIEDLFCLKRKLTVQRFPLQSRKPGDWSL